MRMMRCAFWCAVILLAVNVSLFAQQPALQLTTMPPCRVIDTRQHGGPIPGGTYRSFNVLQLAQTSGCQSLTTAVAYVLNVTVVPQGTLHYLTIWPTGQSQPTVSLMNSLDGRVKANAAIVTGGTTGSVNVFVTNTANVILDITGYFQPATTTALAFYPLDPPCRVADTRQNSPLQADTERDFDVLGSGCGVPPNAQAYSLNFTVLPNPQGQMLDYLIVWPAGQQRPTTSLLNNRTATYVANASILGANGTDGEVAVYPTNSTDLLIDINGYFAPTVSPQSGNAYYTLTPCRALDTRPHPFSGQQTENIEGSQCAPPSVAVAYALNATALPMGRLGYLSLWPADDQRPTVSTLNAIDGAYTSNMAIVENSSGMVNAFAAGTTNLLLDLAGYFGPLGQLTIATISLPSPTTGQQYHEQLMATGGEQPYTWTLISGSLPAGLTMTAGGLISGIPTTPGNYNFSVQVTDQFDDQATRTYTGTVASGTLVVTTPSLPTGTAGVYYSATLAASGGTPPYTWSMPQGSLPAGLTLNSMSGVISGTPTTPGPSTFTVEAQDTSNNTAMANLGIAVGPQDNVSGIVGRYAFSFNGYNSSGPVYLAGSFTADGAGHVDGGVLDLNNPQAPSTSLAFTGTYTTSANGIGTMTFNVTGLGTLNFTFAVFYNGNGQLLETDSGQTGSGLFFAQTVSQFQVPPARNYAVGTFGTDATLKRYAKAGAFTVGSSGAVTAGAEDVNDNGATSTRTFTGSFGQPSGQTGRGVVQLTFSDGSTNNYVYYVVNSNQFILLGSDAIATTDPLTLASIQVQSGSLTNSSLSGNTIYAVNALETPGNSPQPDAVLGLINWDGVATGTATLDENNGGNQSLYRLQGTYSVASNGRVTTNGLGNSTPIMYLIGTNQAFVIGRDSGVSSGTLQPQTASSNIIGTYLGGTITPVLNSITNTLGIFLADGDSNMSGMINTCTLSGGCTLNTPFTSQYVVDASGRAVITSPFNGANCSPTAPCVMYVLNAKTVVFLPNGATPALSIY